MCCFISLSEVAPVSEFSVGFLPLAQTVVVCMDAATSLIARVSSLAARGGRSSC